MFDSLPKYQVINTGNEVILFFPQTLDIISLTPANFAQATPEQLEQCYANFRAEFNKRMALDNTPANQKITLYKLVIDLTDDCNLNCTYCYAEKYYHKRNMSVETAEKIIQKFFLSAAVNVVNQITFFGGEPLLNITVMEYIIHRLEELLAQGKIPRLPQFNIITNGTIYSERVAELFKKYNIGVLVSIDGPAEVQNVNRPFRAQTQTGSFAVVSQNVRQMQQDLDNNVGYECTVTRHTVALGYNQEKLEKFFNEEMNMPNGVCVPEMKTGADKGIDQSKFFPDVNIFFQVLIDLKVSDDGFDVPHRLLMRNPYQITCVLGAASFHILANGDVYPCQLLGGVEKYKIADIDSFNDSYFYKNSWIDEYDKKSAKCNTCWVKGLCKFCPAREILESGSYVMTDQACEHRRREIEDLIINVVNLRKDPEKWNTFRQRLAEKAKVIEKKRDLRSLADIPRY